MNEEALERFAKRSEVNVSTVRKRWKEIPGITKSLDAYHVAEGTRYPYSMRGKTKLDAAKKRYYLLDAIFHDRYIDHTILRCEKTDFEYYLEDLISKGFVRIRKCENQSGANGFIATPMADMIFQRKRHEQCVELAKIIGTAVGACAKELCG